MNNSKESAGLMFPVENCLTVANLLKYRNDAVRQALLSDFSNYLNKSYKECNHDDQLFGNNTRSMADGLVYVHLGLWDKKYAQYISENLIAHGVAHSLTWHESVNHSSGGIHYRFDDQGNVVCRKTSKNNDCKIDGVKLLQASQTLNHAELVAYIQEQYELDQMPSWDNQNRNGQLYFERNKKIVKQAQENTWTVIDKMTQQAYQPSDHYTLEQKHFDNLEVGDRVLVNFKNGDDKYAIRLNVIAIENGLITGLLKSASWESNYNKVGDIIFFNQRHISEVSAQV